GLYSDAARLDEFARIFAAYGSVTSRPVDGDPRVHSLVLWSRDDATALAALARAHSLGTARAAVLPTAPGRRSGRTRRAPSSVRADTPDAAHDQ
ncbi:hypothetical protein J8J40_25165, partial [Mycobacterium tuberculosis]|nr:hypothetical protein [Mycobacterium tuberculosis]